MRSPILYNISDAVENSVAYYIRNSVWWGVRDVVGDTFSAHPSTHLKVTIHACSSKLSSINNLNENN